MEDLSMRVPLMIRFILKNLDDKTLVNFKESSREINYVLDQERFYWIRILNKYKGSFKEFQNFGEIAATVVLFL